MDSSNGVSPRGESSRVDILPVARVAVGIAAEVVSTTVAGSTPFVNGIASILDGLQEAKDHKAKARSLETRLQNIINTTSTFLDMLKQTSTERAAGYLEEFYMGAKQELEKVQAIFSRSKLYLFFYRTSVEGILDDCNSKIVDMNNKLSLQLHLDTTIAIDRVANALEGVDAKSYPTFVKALSPVSGQSNQQIFRDIGVMKLFELKTDAHVDPERIQAFRDCIAGIILPVDIKKFSKENLKVAERNTYLSPPTYQNSSSITRRAHALVAEKGSADQSWTAVAVKSPPNIIVDEEEVEAFRRRYTREIHVLHNLDHEHIVKLYGIYEADPTEDIGQAQFGLVYRYMENLDLYDFCYRNAAYDRLKLLLDAAHGLDWLHKLGIYHGNIKCSNILVDGEMKAAMGDFTKSYSPKLKEKYKLFALSHSVAPDYAWWAPEQIKETAEPPTAGTDIYAFASTIVECLTLKKPFAEKASTWVQVYQRVTNSENAYPELRMRRPDRPKSRWMTDRLWKFILQCWAEEPEDRPHAGDLVTELFLARREINLRNAQFGNPDSKAEQ